MSESLSTANNHVPDQLIEQLAKGYDALAVEMKALNEQRQDLENRLSWAKQQYLDALKRFSPDTAAQDFRVFLGELDEAAATEKEGGASWMESLLKSSSVPRRNRAYDIQRAADAREKVRYRQKSTDSSYGVKIWSGKSADGPDSASVLERDYTTPGTPGGLRCPFAGAAPARASFNSGTRGVSTPRSSVSRTSLTGRRSKRASFHDPIRAESCGNDPGPSATASVEGSIPLCPIRFLDQHSPEEVAAYFEKHKHELPRSHEVCVKRYQGNEQQVRQLDAKYDSLVSMIQGLGVKHQPMLPESPADEGPDDPSNEKIEAWAKTVSASLEKVVPIDAENQAVAGDAERLSRFDRPMEEIRLGESPSRPWGIQVPSDARLVTSPPPENPEETSLPVTMPVASNTTQASAACPFARMRSGGRETDHDGRGPQNNAEIRHKEHPHPPAELRPVYLDVKGQLKDNDIAENDNNMHSPRMVFTGPVFIGFSMEQAKELLNEKAYLIPGFSDK